MDERALEVFLMVARHLSFSDAARELHLSQPAVSQQIRRLEAELSTRLFDRTSRRVHMTPAGAALLGRANDLLREHAEARRAVRSAAVEVAGGLSIAASLTIGGYLLPPVLAQLAQRAPALRIRVRIENTQEVAESLLAGRADLGFVEGDVVARGLTLTRVREDELVVITAATHRFAGSETIQLGDLAKEAFVLREPGSGTRQVAERHLESAGLDPKELRVVAELSSIDAVKTAVAASLGVSIISKTAVVEGVASGLSCQRIEGLRIARQFASATVAGAATLPAATILLDLLRRQ